MFSCDIDECAISDKPGHAVEMHFRLRGGAISAAWPCCANCVEASKKMDAEYDERWSKHRATFLYLPIVQPVVDSEQAIAMEVALHAACRLLRICKGDDEAEQALALLRQAQAEAWDRVHGRAA